MADAEQAKAAGDEEKAAKAEALAAAMTQAEPAPRRARDHRRPVPRDRAGSRARHVDRVRGRRRPARVREARVDQPAARHLPVHEPAGPEGAVDECRGARRALPHRSGAPGRGRAAHRPRVRQRDGVVRRDAAAASQLTPARSRRECCRAHCRTATDLVQTCPHLASARSSSATRSCRASARIVISPTSSRRSARAASGSPGHATRATIAMRSRPRSAIRSRAATSCSPSAASARHPTITRGRPRPLALGVPLAAASRRGRRARSAIRRRGLSAPRADGRIPGGRDDHSESGQSRRVVLDPRPPLLSGLSADGVADARLGAGDARAAARRRRPRASAPSSSTARARASCSR